MSEWGVFKELCGTKATCHSLYPKTHASKNNQYQMITQIIKLKILR